MRLDGTAQRQPAIGAKALLPPPQGPPLPGCREPDRVAAWAQDAAHGPAGAGEPPRDQRPCDQWQPAITGHDGPRDQPQMPGPGRRGPRLTGVFLVFAALVVHDLGRLQETVVADELRREVREQQHDQRPDVPARGPVTRLVATTMDGADLVMLLLAHL